MLTRVPGFLYRKKTYKECFVKSSRKKTNCFNTPGLPISDFCKNCITGRSKFCMNLSPNFIIDDTILERIKKEPRKCIYCCIMPQEYLSFKACSACYRSKLYINTYVDKYFDSLNIKTERSKLVNKKSKTAFTLSNKEKHKKAHEYRNQVRQKARDHKAQIIPKSYTLYESDD